MTVTVREAVDILDEPRQEIYEMIHRDELTAEKNGRRYEIKENFKFKNKLSDRKIYCKKADKCVWADRTNKKKAYCPFVGCMKDGK